ncbi:MAG: hypothetical protein NTX05_03575 [Fusobacteria bacterium]|nr:hypothetical protein [Fusobacteriota bacterium]
MKKFGKLLCTIFEILRYVLIFLGIFIAQSLSPSTTDMRFAIVTLFFVLGISGLTGLESVFLRKYASKQSGYGDGGRYQIQSGLNNLSVAITAVIAYIFKWGTQAELVLMSVMIIFILLSGFNHYLSSVKDGNKSIKNLSRPIGSVVLLVVVLYYMVPVLVK